MASLPALKLRLSELSEKLCERFGVDRPERIRNTNEVDLQFTVDSIQRVLEATTQKEKPRGKRGE